MSLIASAISVVERAPLPDAFLRMGVIIWSGARANV